MKIFKDRQAAGKLLANRLKNTKADLVLGIPRGGVVVAREVAKALGLPLDIVVTRKIGAPGQEELALGAADADGQVFWDERMINDLSLKIDDLGDKVKEALEEIKRREETYRQGKKPLDLKNKTVVLVDDGIATGATVLSAVRYIKRHQSGSQGTPCEATHRMVHGEAKVILAVPVISKEAMDRIGREFGPTSPRLRGVKEFGEMIVLEIPEDFQAVGQFYQQFEVVTDEEVIYLLSKQR